LHAALGVPLLPAAPGVPLLPAALGVPLLPAALGVPLSHAALGVPLLPEDCKHRDAQGASPIQRIVNKGPYVILSVAKDLRFFGFASE